MLGKPFRAEIAPEWFFSCVYPEVTFKMVSMHKALRAEITQEWFFSSVYHKVMFKSVVSSKALVTELTLEWLLPCVDSCGVIGDLQIG